MAGDQEALEGLQGHHDCVYSEGLFLFWDGGWAMPTNTLFIVSETFFEDFLCLLFHWVWRRKINLSPFSCCPSTLAPRQSEGL